jgi:hypothetical protein
MEIDLVKTSLTLGPRPTSVVLQQAASRSNADETVLIS